VITWFLKVLFFSQTGHNLCRYASFITACQRSGNLNAAVEAAEQHNLLGFHVSKRALKRLMLCAAEDTRRLDLVVRTYAMWQKLGLKVDEGTVNTMVQSACACGDFDTAAKWLRSFVESGVDVHVKVRLCIC
jgi:pentatricopeptide repeat protein